VELHGDDFVLRVPASADADAIAAELADEDIVRFIPLIPSPYTHSDAESWIERAGNAWVDGSSCPFVIVDADAGKLLGAIEVRPVRGDIGYWVAGPARGRGVATRALRLICGWRQERPLWLVTHPDNTASQRVAEKAGFRRVGLVPHEPHFRDGTTEAVRFELD
jgi:RimJ/RimL family protein N-acetyltransferase